MAEKVTTLDVKGQKFEVDLQVEEGRRGEVPKTWFVTRVGDGVIKEPTVEALYARLLKATKDAAAKVAVPFVRLYDGPNRKGPLTVERMVATGIHAANRNVLARPADGGRSEQLGSISGDRILRGLTEDEEVEAKRLHAAFVEARDSWGRFTYERKIDLRAAIEAALEGGEPA